MSCQIIVSPTILKALGGITDRRVREKIRDRIDGLAQDPEIQGKPLLGELTGYRSVRAVGQRYRIIYRVEVRRVVVFVLTIGLRRQGSKSDIYSLAKKLLRLRLLEPPGR